VSLLDDLLDLERRFWGAGGDPAFYREHFAENGRCVFGIGILDKAATLTGVEQGAPWTDLQISDPQVVEIGAGVAALVYRATARPAGGDEPGEPYEVYVSSTYVQRDDRWQLLLHQHSPALTEAPTA
jgi:hypothetical protein